MMLLQWFIFPPPPSVFIKAMSVISLTSIAILGFSEMRGKHLNYSKFWNSNSQNSTSKRQIKLSGRAGMLLLYTPAFLAAFISLLLLPHHHIRFVLLNSALALHFFKRIFEVLFVHRFSSDMVLNSAIVISLSYFSSTSTMIYAQKLTQGLPEPPIDLMYFGIVLFLIGIFGNFYHHYILSNLRGNGTFFYLMGRSYATRRWYHSKFEDFPQHIKALIPYIF
ncbi:uncharacterized protein LOC132799092 isoform X2 [Ziziphus jujuba]|uniref:Uncharacterized protein LOC132799092 isoform X2 n=1 Tax=Ziziphus jujuba TaxID=326968 RepID=A0ABM3IF17_ZIZJJ|nr:uncharacterized protein LOC132799092 isoform X2 [Ziziphus jujuba]